MAGYKDEEIETTVTKFVKSSIKSRRDPLGPTDIDTAFTDVLQLLSSTLLLDPNAIFYLIYLATNKLNAVVEALIEDVEDLEEAVDEVGRRTTQVVHSSLLADASAALLDVDNILTQKNALSSQAFSRYTSAVNSFITQDVAPNIKHSGLIKRPPPLARDEARTVMLSLETDYVNLLTNVAQVELMLSEFLGLDLGVAAIRDSVRQARDDLGDLQTYFKSTANTNDDKIGKTREAYLRLTSGKAVLSNLSRIADPTDPRMVYSSTVKGFAALPTVAANLIPAKVTTSKSAPWLITTGVNDQLVIKEDAAVAATTYTLTPPSYPNAQNILAETYNIHGDAYASITSTLPENYTVLAGFDWFVAQVALPGQSLTTFSGQVGVGVYTGAALAALIAANVQDSLSNPLSSVVTVSYSGGIKLTHQTYGDDALIIIGQKLDGSGNPIDINSVVGFVSGSKATGGAYANNLFQLDGGNVATLPAGVSVTAAQIKTFIDSYNHGTYPVGTYEGTVVSVGAGNGVKITKKLAGQTTLTITAPTGSSRTTVLAALTTLGFYEGQSDSSLGMSAAEVADVLNTVGKVAARVVVTKYEAGTTGTITGATTMTVPSGAINTGTSHADDQLLLTTGPSAGYHRIVSIAPGSPMVVTVAATTPFNYGGSSEPNQSWRVVREAVEIKSDVGFSLSTALAIQSASANSTLGLSVYTFYGTTTGFVVKDTTTSILKSFTQANVVKKDIISFPGSGLGTQPIAEVATSGTQVELTEGIPTNIVNQNFRIVSAAAYAYELFTAALESWNADLAASKYSQNLRELGRVLNIALTPTRPSQAQKADALNELDDVKNLLTDLSSKLVAFVVDPVSRIDSSLKMLKERSLDRAYDLLLSGYVKTVFTMAKDDASRSTYMLKTARAITQKDLAVSSHDEYGDDDRLVADYEDTDANFDTSDADTDENLSILGEVGYYSESDQDAANKGF